MADEEFVFGTNIGSISREIQTALSQIQQAVAKAGSASISDKSINDFVDRVQARIRSLEGDINRLNSRTVNRVQNAKPGDELISKRGTTGNYAAQASALSTKAFKDVNDAFSQLAREAPAGAYGIRSAIQSLFQHVAEQIIGSGNAPSANLRQLDARLQRLAAQGGVTLGTEIASARNPGAAANASGYLGVTGRGATLLNQATRLGGADQASPLSNASQQGLVTRITQNVAKGTADNLLSELQTISNRAVGALPKTNLAPLLGAGGAGSGSGGRGTPTPGAPGPSQNPNLGGANNLGGVSGAKLYDDLTKAIAAARTNPNAVAEARQIAGNTYSQQIGGRTEYLRADERTRTAEIIRSQLDLDRIRDASAKGQLSQLRAVDAQVERSLADVRSGFKAVSDSAFRDINRPGQFFDRSTRQALTIGTPAYEAASLAFARQRQRNAGALERDIAAGNNAAGSRVRAVNSSAAFVGTPRLVDGQITGGNFVDRKNGEVFSPDDLRLQSAKAKLVRDLEAEGRAEEELRARTELLANYRAGLARRLGNSNIFADDATGTRRYAELTSRGARYIDRGNERDTLRYDQLAANDARQQPRTVGQGFLAGLTSAGFGGNSQGGINFAGLAQAAGTTVKYSTLYAVLNNVQQAAGQAITELLNFEDSIANIQLALDTTDEPAQSFINNLAQIASVAGANVGDAMDVAAQGMQAFGDETKQTREEIEAIGVSFAKSARNLSIVTGDDLQTSSSQLRAIVSGITQPGQDVTPELQTNVLDAIAGAKSKFGGDSNDIAEGFQAISTSATQAGFSVNEITNIAATVTSKLGESGTLAGTRLSRLFAIIGGREGQNALRALNGQLQPDQQVDITANAATQIKQLSALYGQLSDKQREALGNSLGGTANTRELFTILANGNEILETGSNEFDYYGKNAEEVARRLDNLRGQIQQITGALRNIIVYITQSGALEPLLAGFGLLVPLLQSIQGLFATFALIPKPIRTIAFALLEVYAALRLIQAISARGGLGAIVAGGARRAEQFVAPANAAARAAQASTAAAGGAPIVLAPTGPAAGLAQAQQARTLGLPQTATAAQRVAALRADVAERTAREARERATAAGQRAAEAQRTVVNNGSGLGRSADADRALERARADQRTALAERTAANRAAAAAERTYTQTLTGAASRAPFLGAIRPGANVVGIGRGLIGASERFDQRISPYLPGGGRGLLDFRNDRLQANAAAGGGATGVRGLIADLRAMERASVRTGDAFRDLRTSSFGTAVSSNIGKVTNSLRQLSGTGLGTSLLLAAGITAITQAYAATQGQIEAINKAQSGVQTGPQSDAEAARRQSDTYAQQAEALTQSSTGIVNSITNELRQGVGAITSFVTGVEERGTGDVAAETQSLAEATKAYADRLDKLQARTSAGNDASIDLSNADTIAASLQAMADNGRNAQSQLDAFSSSMRTLIENTRTGTLTLSDFAKGAIAAGANVSAQETIINTANDLGASGAAGISEARDLRTVDRSFVGNQAQNIVGNLLNQGVDINNKQGEKQLRDTLNARLQETFKAAGLDDDTINTVVDGIVRSAQQQARVATTFDGTSASLAAITSARSQTAQSAQQRNQIQANLNGSTGGGARVAARQYLADEQQNLRDAEELAAGQLAKITDPKEREAQRQQYENTLEQQRDKVSAAQVAANEADVAYIQTLTEYQSSLVPSTDTLGQTDAAIKGLQEQIAVTTDEAAKKGLQAQLNRAEQQRAQQAVERANAQATASVDVRDAQGQAQANYANATRTLQQIADSGDTNSAAYFKAVNDANSAFIDVIKANVAHLDAVGKATLRAGDNVGEAIQDYNTAILNARASYVAGSPELAAALREVEQTQGFAARQAVTARTTARRNAGLDNRDVIGNAQSELTDLRAQLADLPEGADTERAKLQRQIAEQQQQIAEDTTAQANAARQASVASYDTLGQARVAVQNSAASLANTLPGTEAYYQALIQLRQDQFNQAQRELQYNQTLEALTINPGNTLELARKAARDARAKAQQFDPGTQERADADLAALQAEFAQRQEELATRQAERSAAVFAGDYLGSATADVENARDALANAVPGTKEFFAAQKAFNDAAYALAQAQVQAAAETRKLNIDLSNPVQSAAADLTAARDALAAAQAAGAPSSVTDKLRNDVRNAELQQDQAAFSQRLSDTQIADQLGRISHAQYISYLKGEHDRLTSRIAGLKETDNGYRQAIDQLNQIDQLINDAKKSLNQQFNLQDVTLPTLYEVRRAVGVSADQIRSQVVDYSSTQGTVIINGADMNQVMAYINKTLGKGSTAVYTTSPLRV